jgi:xylulokinase
VGRADPVSWVNSVKAAVRALGPAAADARAVGLSVHCPTALIFDSDGEPLTTGLTWDHPALVDLTVRLAPLRTERETRLTGNRLSPATFMAASHAFFTEHEPDALAQASTLGLVGTWMGQWFTGERALDPTQASYTGAFSSTDGGWDWLHEFVARLGIPEDLLPPVRPSLSVLGELRGFVARSLGLPAGIPVIVGSADTPAASYLLGARPGGTPLFIMGTTHVISNCVSAPDHRAQALQRADVRPGQWLINGVTNGGDALAIGARLLGYGSAAGAVAGLIEDAGRATPKDAVEAPVFIPHVVPERGPLWLDRPKTALTGLVANTSAPAAARGVLEGVLFADRMIIESCVTEEQGPLFLSGAFGSDVLVPQFLADVLDREIQVVDEGHLPSIGAAAMCLETLEGIRSPAPRARPVRPRKPWKDVAAQRWAEFRTVWQGFVGRPPLTQLTTCPSGPTPVEGGSDG